MIKAYGLNNAFSNAQANCVIKRLNNAPKGDGGVDEQTQETLEGHGICSGMTTTWLIGFLNNRADASDPAQFQDYFMNVLRFQGAYLKESGGRADSQLDELAKAHLDHGLKALSVATAKVADGKLPFPKSPWAAYVSIWGHAIGIGERDGKWYMMDPNYGLFVYSGRDTFLADFSAIVEARRTKKGKGPNDTIKLLFYALA
ncbi:hypothetical protein [Myxococcus sp. RHSTA-1-4]|uniref:hypothetical protein n=1 Tax=Myxococcus sp. RHSTA-1-4 TaxID=2874601 RepID=UPI001CBDA5C3|nr:hypothetical protein [Myxococcus sp. RHSTA-1-4]MBZ4418482.1 hypothetical protein [Myxococcus sp. RHSTA-1-4]